MQITPQQIEELLDKHGKIIEQKLSDLESKVTKSTEDRLKALKDEQSAESARKAEDDRKAREEADRKVADAKKKAEENKTKTPEQIQLEEQKEKIAALEKRLLDTSKSALSQKFFGELSEYSKEKLMPGVENLIRAEFFKNGAHTESLDGMVFTVGGQQFSDVKKAFDRWIELPEHAGYKAPLKGTNSPSYNPGGGSFADMDPFTAAAIADGKEL